MQGNTASWAGTETGRKTSTKTINHQSTPSMDVGASLARLPLQPAGGYRCTLQRGNRQHGVQTTLGSLAANLPTKPRAISRPVGVNDAILKGQKLHPRCLGFSRAARQQSDSEDSLAAAAV
ncbi:hypothetical protein E4U55_005303 [Claviceps digitariae]|nr:hypothetical protein E4U55_005303 [Claviceps digitariae]